MAKNVEASTSPISRRKSPEHFIQSNLFYAKSQGRSRSNSKNLSTIQPEIKPYNSEGIIQIASMKNFKRDQNINKLQVKHVRMISISKLRETGRSISNPRNEINSNKTLERSDVQSKSGSEYPYWGSVKSNYNSVRSRS